MRNIQKNLNRYMKTVTTAPNQVFVNKYCLYLNTFDNTMVILTEDFSDLFERTLTSMGSAPKLIAQSHILSDLQFKAVEVGINPYLITDLNV